MEMWCIFCRWSDAAGPPFVQFWGGEGFVHAAGAAVPPSPVVLGLACRTGFREDIGTGRQMTADVKAKKTVAKLGFAGQPPCMDNGST